MAQPSLSLRGITKSFGRNRVLEGIDLELNGGEVVVLMGANGAGKSTLVKIMCGFHQADGGQMTLGSQEYSPHTPAAALAQGIVTVHQAVNDGVIPDLDVASNLMLATFAERGAGFWINRKRLWQEAQQMAEAMGLDFPLGRRVAELSVADRQMLAIARAMAHDPKVLILDEPTSALSETEAARLFALLDTLRAQGVAILYISHRMSDIRRIADRIIAMRDGAISGTFDEHPLDFEAAVTAMLGHAMTEVDIVPQTGSDAVLELGGFQLSPEAKPFDLSARAGEVIAITGLLGSGKSRLSETLFGLRPVVAGTMALDGAPYAPRSAMEAKERGVFLSPKDRASNAVIPDFDLADNMALPFLRGLSVAGFIKTAQQRRQAAQKIDDLGIVCQSERDGIGTLSGGNQQKTMIARWMMAPARVLLLDEPFQGVDIGARRDIGATIRRTAAERATLVFVAEIDEALEIADRIIVMHENEIVGEHSNKNVDLGRMVAQISGQTEVEHA